MQFSDLVLNLDVFFYVVMAISANHYFDFQFFIMMLCKILPLFTAGANAKATHVLIVGDM